MKRPKPSPFRRHWDLKSGTIFLNHGSFGACPKSILKLQSELRHEMEAEPVQFLWRRYEERLEPSRAALAKFVGVRSRDLVFVTNSTTGVNAVARSLDLRPNDELLTTSLDYNACHNVLVETVRRANARLVTARIPFPVRTEDEIVGAVLDAVTSRTRLAMVDHITSDSALIMPVARLVRELDARGVDTLVDGAHAAGMVPLDITRLRPAYYTGNLHKWVCAPKGAAFLWVREDKQSDVQPPVISHGNNRRRSGFSRFQDRFDWAGTFDPTPWLCVGAAIRWMEELLPGGWPELRQRNHELAARARKILCEQWQVEPACPQVMLGSMATVRLPQKFQSKAARGKIDDEQMALYDRFAIEVPLSRIGRPARRHCRISAQVYNSTAEYEFLAETALTL